MSKPKSPLDKPNVHPPVTQDASSAIDAISKQGDRDEELEPLLESPAKAPTQAQTTSAQDFVNQIIDDTEALEAEAMPPPHPED
jgi:hypothetical protein